jgi:predicted HicB family RNase H-like nuclease
MKTGTKTINISPELHQKIRIHCAKNGLKINEFIEKELEETILRYVKGL